MRKLFTIAITMLIVFGNIVSSTVQPTHARSVVAYVLPPASLKPGVSIVESNATKYTPYNSIETSSHSSEMGLNYPNILTPQDTRPPADPTTNCNNSSGKKLGPDNPPTPFLYQPFSTAQPFIQIWTSQMDHASPKYTRDGVVATLGEKLRYNDHHPAYPGDPHAPLAAGTQAWNVNGSGPTFFDYTIDPRSREYLGYKLFYYESPSIESYIGYDGHDGHDFGITGDALAAAAGIVAWAGNNGDAYGNVVEIYHPEGYLTRYAHLASISVTKDQPVSIGQTIGVIGGSGGWPVHLHFSVYTGHWRKATLTI